MYMMNQLTGHSLRGDWCFTYENVGWGLLCIRKYLESASELSRTTLEWDHRRHSTTVEQKIIPIVSHCKVLSRYINNLYHWQSIIKSKSHICVFDYLRESCKFEVSNFVCHGCWVLQPRNGGWRLKSRNETTVFKQCSTMFVVELKKHDHVEKTLTGMDTSLSVGKCPCTAAYLQKHQNQCWNAQIVAASDPFCTIFIIVFFFFGLVFWSRLNWHVVVRALFLEVYIEESKSLHFY